MHVQIQYKYKLINQAIGFSSASIATLAWVAILTRVHDSLWEHSGDGRVYCFVFYSPPSQPK